MSFGLARGKALDVGRVGIEMRTLPSPEDGLIDPRSWFEDPSKPLEVEIGSGKGTFLLQEAKQRSEVNYLGFEWSGEFYRYAADRIRRNHLNNAKLVYGDATEFLKFWCKEQIADVIHLYFSDPWPKKRHHKRRVIQDDSLLTFHRVLMPKGEIRIVTDHDELWQWCLDHFDSHTAHFSQQTFGTVESADEGELVGSNFERKYRKEERPFHATTLIRIN